MPKMTTISPRGPLNTPLTERMARKAARYLRGRGFAVSISTCRDRAPKQIANMLTCASGQSAGVRPSVLLADSIAAAVGLMPAQEGA